MKTQRQKPKKASVPAKPVKKPTVEEVVKKTLSMQKKKVDDAKDLMSAVAEKPKQEEKPKKSKKAKKISDKENKQLDTLFVAIETELTNDDAKKDKEKKHHHHHHKHKHHHHKNKTRPGNSTLV